MQLLYCIHIICYFKEAEGTTMKSIIAYKLEEKH